MSEEEIRQRLFNVVMDRRRLSFFGALIWPALPASIIYENKGRVCVEVAPRAMHRWLGADAEKGEA